MSIGVRWRVLASVGIVRFMKSCEAMATRGSVWIWASGIWRWRVAKKVMRACMVWSALGALFVHGLQSLCWKNEVGVSIDDRRQSAQCFARMSGRVTGGDGRRWESGVRAAVASHVKHMVQMWEYSPCLSQQ